VRLAAVARRGLSGMPGRDASARLLVVQELLKLAPHLKEKIDRETKGVKSPKI
jgi:hypothetical protein